MYEDKTILAFIGARAGSKGLIGKNIIDCLGQPLISWTIKASKASKFIDRTIVSTDSEETVRVSKASGADVPFLRPKSLAQDNSIINDAILHAIDWLNENEKNVYDYILMLQPTSPLRGTDLINSAIEYYFKHKRTCMDTMVSVSNVASKYGWLMQKKNNDYIRFSFEIKKGKLLRQELPEYYLPNGAIYFAPTKNFSKKGFYGDNVLPYVMDEDRSIDIDTKEDLEKTKKILGERL